MADSQQIGTLKWTAATRGQSGNYGVYEQEPHYQVIYYGTAHSEEYQECVLWLPWTYFFINYSEMNPQYNKLMNPQYNKLMMVLCASAPVKTEQDFRLTMLPNTCEQYGSICLGNTNASDSAEKEIEKFWSRGFNNDLALLRKQWAEVFPAMKKSLVDPLQPQRTYASVTDFFEHWSSLTPDEVTAIDWPPVNWTGWQVAFRTKRGNR